MTHDELTYLYKILRCVWSNAEHNIVQNLTIKINTAEITITKKKLIPHLQNTGENCTNCQRFIGDKRKCQINCIHCTGKKINIDKFFNLLVTKYQPKEKYYPQPQNIIYEHQWQKYFYINYNQNTEELHLSQISQSQPYDDNNRQNSFFIIDPYINKLNNIIYSKIESLAHHNWKGFEILSKDLIKHKLKNNKFTDITIELEPPNTPSLDLRGEAKSNRKKHLIFAQVKAYKKTSIVGRKDVSDAFMASKRNAHTKPFKLFFITSATFSSETLKIFQNTKETKDNLWHLSRITQEIISNKFYINQNNYTLKINEKYWTDLYNET